MPSPVVRCLAPVLLAFSVATAGLPAVAGQDSGSDLSRVTLRIGIFEDVTHDAVAATDFLKNTPYKITWARLNGAGPTVQALGGDAIDLSWGLSDTAAPKASSEDRQNWAVDNAPIKIIALMKAVNGNEFSPSLIIANKDSGVRTLGDLRGKTYAFNEGGNANAIALLALDKAGLTLKDVQVRLLTYDATAPAVVAGAVAAAPATRARIADALSDGSVRQIATDTEVGFPGFVSITARTAAIADPAKRLAIGDFLHRVAHYLSWAATRPEEIARSYVKTEQLTEAQALFAAKSGAYRLIPVDPDSDGYRQEVAVTQTLGRIGFYPRPVDFSTVVDPRYTGDINDGNHEP